MAQSQNIKKKYKELIESLNNHNFLYHNLDAPKISDSEYDAMFRELLSIEEDYPELIQSDSPSKRVGDAPISELLPFQHQEPMLSLDNAFSDEDLKDFETRALNKLKKNIAFTYYCEPKIDGVAISLFYKKGKLEKAGTRGDGEIGEDVTHNVLTIKQIPLNLRNSDYKFPEEIEIRGEIYIEKDDFHSFNKKYQKEGKKTFANPRNFAAGSIRQLDPNIANSRPLKIFCHSIGYVNPDNLFDSHMNLSKAFKSWGLPICEETYYSESLEDTISNIGKLTKKRESLNYEIDGIVVKINDHGHQKLLGFSSRSPKWSIARKFEAEEGTSEILSISFQMGRTGVLTPVANLKPVKIGGVVISNATLHNMDEVERLDLREGDTVKVKRAGDVIPKIVSVVLSKRKKRIKKIIEPKLCKSCGNNLEFFSDQTPLLDITNLNQDDLNCFSFDQFKETLKHFVSRNALDIEGFGSKTINLLVNKGYVKSIPDLYKIDTKDILKLDGFAEKSSIKLIQSIQESKFTDLYRFIYGLGIKEIGLETSKNLANHFGSLDNISNASKEDFIKIKDVGEVAAKNLNNFFSNPKYLSLIERLKKIGMDLIVKETSIKLSHLSEKIVVITGKFLDFSRNDLKNILEEMGAKVVSSISAKTDFLLAGDEAGSKFDKAKDLGITIIPESDLDGFLKNND